MPGRQLAICGQALRRESGIGYVTGHNAETACRAVRQGLLVRLTYGRLRAGG